MEEKNPLSRSETTINTGVLSVLVEVEENLLFHSNIQSRTSGTAHHFKFLICFSTTNCTNFTNFTRSTSGRLLPKGRKNIYYRTGRISFEFIEYCAVSIRLIRFIRCRFKHAKVESPGKLRVTKDQNIQRSTSGRLLKKGRKKGKKVLWVMEHRHRTRSTHGYHQTAD